jgi:hypothetical protein
MKPVWALVTFVIIIVLFGIGAKKLLYKDEKNNVLFGWAVFSLFLGLYLITIFMSNRINVANLDGKYGKDKKSSKYWDADYDFFSTDLYIDSFKDKNYHTDARYSQPAGTIYIVPLLLGITSILLLPMMKFNTKLIAPIIAIQTFLLSYTLVSSPNNIITTSGYYSSLNYTILHLLLTSFPFLLSFNLI